MYQFSPSLIKPPRWNVQPHLTAAPELSSYVTAGIAYWGDQYEDFVANRTAPIQSAITKVVGEVGVGYNIGTNEDNIGGVNLPFNSDRIYTYIATFKAASTNSNSNNFRAQFVGHVDTASNDGAILNIDLGGRVFIATFGGNTGGDNGNAKVVDDGAVHTTAVTFDQVNNRIIQSVDGQIDYNVSYSDTSSQSNSVFGLAPQPQAGGNDSDVTVFSQYVLETPFQPAEILLNSITTDPFAMLRPGPQLLPLLFGGAGATGSTVTDTALITSATTSSLTANETATANDTAITTSAAASPLTATETAVASDTAQITAVSATPLTATATASATDTAQITSAFVTPLTANATAVANDTAQITSATVTTLTASETTSAAVTDTAVITSAFATPLTAVETAIANDTAVITNAIVTTLVANENIGDLVSATATAQLTLPAPGSRTINPQGTLAYITPSAGSRLVTPDAPGSTSILPAGALAQITPNAGSRLVTPNAPGSQSVTPDASGSTTVTPRAD